MTSQIIIVALLCAFFMFASTIKIFGWQKFIFEAQLTMFIKYGLNRQIMALIGFIELFGAIAIWFLEYWVGTVGALMLLTTSTGAIFCHLYFDTWKDAIPAMTTGMLSGFIAWTNRDPLLELLTYMS